MQEQHYYLDDVSDGSLLLLEHGKKGQEGGKEGAGDQVVEEEQKEVVPAKDSVGSGAAKESYHVTIPVYK